MRGEGECGMCVECKEWCDVGASCCGRGVYFEGGFVADRDEDEPSEEQAGGLSRTGDE